jgi:hypothetical protein
VCALLALSLAAMAEAELVNAGFESGDLGGWQAHVTTGQVHVVTSHPSALPQGRSYVPKGGRYFVAIDGGRSGQWQQLSQSFYLGARETLGGAAAFDWGGLRSGVMDGVKVEIFDARGALLSTAFNAHGALVGYNTPWSPWSFTADVSGYYTVVLSVRNADGGLGLSTGYFDVSTIPEPSSLSLAVLGLGTAWALRHRRA